MICNLDSKEREAYKTRSHGTIQVLIGTQNFRKNFVIVWVDNKRGYVSCPICYVPHNGGYEIAFKLDWDIVFFSHYTNGDQD
jgi:hypothetical protein